MNTTKQVEVDKSVAQLPKHLAKIKVTHNMDNLGNEYVVVKGYESSQHNELLTEKHYKNGLLHRDGDEPASIKWVDVHKSGVWIDTQDYYKDGLLHRDGDEPASIKYDGDGAVERECYANNGVIKTIKTFDVFGDFVAAINYNDDGSEVE